MNNNIRKKWLVASKNPARFLTDLRKNWMPEVVDDFLGLTAKSPTARRILEQFDTKNWYPYKSYNHDCPMWEYMVLLKLVYLRRLYVHIDLINGRETLIFQKVNNSRHFPYTPSREFS